MSVSTSYAKALYEIAKEEGFSESRMADLEAHLKFFSDTLETYPEARNALLGPTTTYKEKAQLLEALGKVVQAEPNLVRFLHLVAKKKRLKLLSDIRKSFTQLRLEVSGGIAAQVVSSEALSEADVADLVKALGQKLGKKVSVETSVDPALLAGIKVTVQGVTYDGSLRSQFQKLKDTLISGIAGNQG